MPVPDNLLPLTLFAFIGAFTPGPNNIMIAASGSAFGFRRSLPHMAGVAVGFALMLACFALGLGQLMRTVPVLQTWLRVLGAVYLLYLAWRLAQASGPDAATTPARPLSFLEAALFQWLNPKAWTLALGVTAAFTTARGDLLTELAVINAVFGVATVGSLATWCLFGVGIRRLLSSDRAVRRVNLALAALVAVSVVTLFL